MFRIMALVGLVCWVYTLYHCYNNPRLDSGRRVLWFLGILLFSPIASFAYWIFHCMCR